MKLKKCQKYPMTTRTKGNAKIIYQLLFIISPTKQL